MLNKYFISAALLLFIQSCGSDSSSSKAPEQPVEYQFNLSAKLANQCGGTQNFNLFEVHVQDDNWQLIEKYSADVNGKVSFTSTDKEINYTIVAKSQQGDDEEHLDIVSYYQVQTATPAAYYARYDTLQNNSSCECVTQDIELQHRAFADIATVSTSFSYDNWIAIDSRSTYFIDAKVCRVVDESWPVHTISLRGIDSNDNAIGVASLLEDFTSNIDNLWQAAAVEVASNVALPRDHAAFEMRQLFKDGEHFESGVEQVDQELLVFDTHAYISESSYQSSSENIFEDLDTIFGQSLFASYHQLKTSLYDQAFDVFAETTKPAIDNIGFSELAADGSYDYSAVAGYPLVKITFDYQVSSLTTMPVTWTMYGPIEGTLASSVQLVGYEDIVSPDTDIENTDINIIKSSTTKNYADYIKHYQGNTNTDFADDLHLFKLTLTL
jgi:hypothetical protein